MPKGNNGLAGWLARGRQWLEGSEPPCVACEVAADSVAAARGAPDKLEAWAVRPLPEAVVRPGPLADNVLNADLLGQALQEVLEEVAAGEKRLAVILPDPVARFWLLTLESLPERPAEVLALLRWRLAKEVAFNLEQAVLSYQVFPRPASGQGKEPAGSSVLVAAAQRSLLRQYEERFEALGFEPVWVTLATLATLGLLEADGAHLRLLVRRDPSALGLAIACGNELRFLRSVPATLSDSSAEALFVHIFASLTYFQDQWRESVSEALLLGAGSARVELARMLGEEAGCVATELRLDPWLGQPRAEHVVDRDRSLAGPLGFLRAGLDR